MSDIALDRCVDPADLIAYLYDECEPGQHDVIAAHVARCADCAAEFASLGSTRRQLAEWAPPDATLGFTIPPGDVAPPAAPPVVLGPARWWSQPLPAWAQAAAAAAIFAAGLAAGTLRTTDADPGVTRVAQAPVPSAAPVARTEAPPAAPGVSREDLERLEQSLRAELRQVAARQTAPPAAAPVAVSAPAPDAAVLQRVRALIDESERRQRADLTLRLGQVVRDFETQRRLDYANVQRTLGDIQGTTAVEVLNQREALQRINNYLVTVSQRR